MNVIKVVYNRLLRPAFPFKIGVANGVAVPNTWRLLERQTVAPNYEDEAVSALKSVVRSGDDVVIIGGGLGITAVWAANQCGPAGHVDVYEAFADTCKQVRETAELNGVGERITVHQKAVDANTSLPDCDVLEIDCEGCEVEILRSLDIEPRVLIVEHHVGKWGTDK